MNTEELAEGIAEHLFSKGRFHAKDLMLSVWEKGEPLRLWKFDEVVELVKHHIASPPQPAGGEIKDAVEERKRPVCGKDGYWCHGTCYRHGRCMYVSFAAPDEVESLKENKK